MSIEDQTTEQEDGLFEHFRFKVDRGQELLRIDKYLLNRIERISRNKIQLAAAADCILVNDKPVKSNYKVKPADDISIVLSKPYPKSYIKAENIPLNIIYEDNDLLVLNKKAGMVVHPGNGNYSGTLVHALAYYLGNSEIKGSEEGRPGIVHRLDKDTSGLMVVAKNDFSMNYLARQFFERSIKRTYTALVWGEFDEMESTVTGHIGRNLRYRKKFTVFPEGDRGKHAVTHFTVLENLAYVSLLECRLETGRTHQIRVHLKYLGHPVFNDAWYGGDKILKGTVYTKYKQFVENCFKLLPRLALHARSLGFIHPSSGEEVFFDSELPEDFQNALNKWRSYAHGLKQDL